MQKKRKRHTRLDAQLLSSQINKMERKSVISSFTSHAVEMSLNENTLHRWGNIRRGPLKNWWFKLLIICRRAVHKHEGQ